MTWIVLVNYNGWDDTRLCLDSLRKQTAPCRIVLVDNDSKVRRLEEFQKEYPEVVCIQSDWNGGWAGGNNIGIEYAMSQNAEHIILLNNDTTVSPHLVESLLRAAHDHPEYGIIGPIIHFMDEPEKVMTDGCVFNHPGYNGFFQRKEVPPTQPSLVTECEVVNGCCMMISRQVVKEIGLIDQRFFLIHEETDYNLRARQAGFKCGILSESLVWHKGSSTFKRTGSKLQRYFDARNLLLLISKHGRKHPEGRRSARSLLTYGKYIYYRYCEETESGQKAAADAVLEGFIDGLRRRYGPMPAPKKRPELIFLRGLFNSAMWLRKKFPQSQSSTH
ncbi:MAG: glycosyltransferase family 2 protein [Gemmataceae bacterium]|jgi:GT2 family glycosyltransferase|nr:glycosyltransferase family 2 protein [Gemmataceae bacterium]